MLPRNVFFHPHAKKHGIAPFNGAGMSSFDRLVLGRTISSGTPRVREKRLVSVSVAIVYMVKPDIHNPAGKAPPFRGNQEKESCGDWGQEKNSNHRLFSAKPNP